MLGERQFDNKKRKVRQKGRLRYATKHYNNPFFGHRRKNPRLSLSSFDLSLKTKIVLLCFVVISTSLVWLFLFSRFFEIKTVMVSGGGRIASTSVEKIVWRQVNNSMFVLSPQKNIFLFNKSRLVKNLEDKFSFNYIDIRKDFPNTINLNYQEKTYDIIWLEGGIYYYADLNGNIVIEVNPLEIKNKEYPLIENQSKEYIQNKTISNSLEHLAFAKNLYDKIGEYDYEFSIEKIIIDDLLNSVKLKIENGPLVYFSIQNDIDKQIRKLLVVKNEKLLEDFFKKTYIDIRIGDSIYFR